jgi:hypothetical protein
MTILATVEVLGRPITGTHQTVEHNGNLYLVIHTANDGSHLGLKLDRHGIVDNIEQFKLDVPMYKGKLAFQDLVAIPSN